MDVETTASILSRQRTVKCADQTARMRRLTCAFVVRILQNRASHDVAHLGQFMLVNEHPSATKGKTLLIEKSRDCHNHTLQPTPDTKKKGNRACKVNKPMHEMHIVQLSYFQAG